MMRRTVGATLLAFVLFGGPSAARAQNDWQYPDPYFGTFAFGRDPGPQTHREYRAEIGPRATHPSPRFVRTRSGRWVRIQQHARPRSRTQQP